MVTYQIFAEEPSWWPSHSAVVQQQWWWDVTSPFPPSGNEGYIHNLDIPFQSVTFNVTSVTDELGSLPKRHGFCSFQRPVWATCIPFWCKPGFATRGPVTVVIALPTQWVRITLGKCTHSSWNRNVAEALSFPKEVSESLTHMNTRLGAYGRLEPILMLLEMAEVCQENTGSKAITVDFTHMGTI